MGRRLTTEWTHELLQTRTNQSWSLRYVSFSPRPPSRPPTPPHLHPLTSTSSFLLIPVIGFDFSSKLHPIKSPDLISVWKLRPVQEMLDHHNICLIVHAALRPFLQCATRTRLGVIHMRRKRMAACTDAWWSTANILCNTLDMSSSPWYESARIITAFLVSMMIFSTSLRHEIPLGDQASLL